MAAAPLDHAVEKIGIGRFQYPLIAAAGLTWSGDAMELSVMAYVLPVLRDEWGISQPAADAFASILFAGMLAGALAWGLFSDAYGRRVGWQATTALTAVAGMLSAAAPEGSVGLFLALRLCVGVGLAGTNLGFALASEWLPRRARGTHLMLTFELFFVGGSLLVVLLAWLALGSIGWRWVLVLATAPLWLALGLTRAVPESPRWLAAHGHAQAAETALRRAAGANGRPPPLAPGALASCASAAEERTAGGSDGRSTAAADAASAAADASDTRRLLPARRSSSLYAACAVACGADGRRAAWRSLMRVAAALCDARLRVRACALCAAWGSAWFVYFGTILLTPKLLAAALPPAANATSSMQSGLHDAHDDAVYASSLLATLAEVPGLLLATCAVHRLGRVRTVAGCMLVAAAALTAMAILHAGPTAELRHDSALYVQLFLLAVGRLACFGGFSALYLLTAEAFPTRLRATAFGLASAASRLAGTLTPFVAGSLWQARPAAALLVYAVAAAGCAATLLCLVRDTGHSPMPDELRRSSRRRDGTSARRERKKKSSTPRFFARVARNWASKLTPL